MSSPKESTTSGAGTARSKGKKKIKSKGKSKGGDRIFTISGSGSGTIGTETGTVQAEASKQVSQRIQRTLRENQHKMVYVHGDAVDVDSVLEAKRSADTTHGRVSSDEEDEVDEVANLVAQQALDNLANKLKAGAKKVKQRKMSLRSQHMGKQLAEAAQAAMPKGKSKGVKKSKSTGKVTAKSGSKPKRKIKKSASGSSASSM